MPVKFLLAFGVWSAIASCSYGLALPSSKVPNQLSCLVESIPETDPSHVQQILLWASDFWGVEYDQVLGDYQKDLLQISPGPDATSWKVSYDGGCALVDLADLL